MGAQRGVYTCPLVEASITAANTDYDLWEFTPADDRPLELVAFNIGVTGEVGDAQDETLTIKISRGFATTGSGGNAAVAGSKLDPRDATSGFTFESANSTVATAGTEVVLFVDSYNVRVGGTWVFPEIMRPRVEQTDVLMVIRQMTTVADTMTLSGTAWVREL